MKIKADVVTMAAVAALSGSDSFGQTNEPSYVTLDSVLVESAQNTYMVGRQYEELRRTQEKTSSVIVLGSKDIEEKNVMNSWELLSQVPGVQMTETRQGAESGKVSFRAFNGEGYINGIKVLIDDIPSNVNSGNQRFTDMIFPLEIDQIEVVKGGSDPRYGLHNIGGNINFRTRQGGNYTDSRVTYGSFDTHEIQVATGSEGDNFAQNYFIAKQDSNGYRSHDTSDKYSVAGKWFYTNDEANLKTGLIIRQYEHEADEPGFLTREELSAKRRQSNFKNANDVSKRRMNQVSLHLDYLFTDDLSLSNKIYYNRYVDDRKVTFSDYPNGDAPRQHREWDEKQIGAISELSWKQSDSLTINSGLNYEHQDNEYRRYRYAYSDGLPTNFSAAPSRVQNDDNFTLNNVGAYTQVVINPTPELTIVPAYRIDKFSGKTELVDGTQASLQDYGWIEQPKLSIAYALTDHVSVYANWGKTFQILTGSTAPAYMTEGQTALSPSINTGREAGIKFDSLAGTTATLAVWEQKATDEVSNMPSTGTTVGLGETKRRGIDMQFSTWVTDKLSVSIAHTVQEAKVMDAYSAAGDSLAGNEVFSTPRHITTGSLEYLLSDKWKIGMQARSQGDYYIDSMNEAGKFGGFTVVDFSTSYAFTESVSADFQLKNALNEEYEYVWYDSFFWGSDSKPMFSPAPRRTAYLSANFKF